MCVLDSAAEVVVIHPTAAISPSQKRRVDKVKGDPLYACCQAASTHCSTYIHSYVKIERKPGNRDNVPALF